MKKVLYVADEHITISGLRLLVQEFTINNGCYPSKIEMSNVAYERYFDLFIKTDWQKCHDIPVVRSKYANIKC